MEELVLHLEYSQEKLHETYKIIGLVAQSTDSKSLVLISTDGKGTTRINTIPTSGSLKEMLL